MSTIDMTVEPTNYAACAVSFVNGKTLHHCNSSSCEWYYDGTQCKRAIKPIPPVPFMSLPPAAVDAKIAAFIEGMRRDTINSRRHRLGIADEE